MSHNRTARFPHKRVDLEVVQERRDRVPVGSRMLHDHANLYIGGRNPMMFYVARNNPLPAGACCGLPPKSLDLTGVVVTDGNASSDYTLRPDAT